MKNPLWTKALKTSADPERSRHLLESLTSAGARSQLEKFSADSIRVFSALSGGSQALGDLLLAHLDWLALLDLERLKFPRRAQGFQQELGRLLGAALKAQNYAAALTELRRFKQRELFRIAARDLARLSNVVEITRELSDVADVCLEAVFQIIRLQFTTRFGRPFHQDADGHWQPTAFAVLGLGKLGGQELNYSSDVDLMFVYDDEGEVFKEPPGGKESPRAVMSSHQFFSKLAEAFNAEVSRTTEDGFLFRVDLRLRPEGDAGPLVRSLESYENYYAQWGQTWERMMLIKTRHVAGDKVLAAEFIETIQPFRFPHFINERVLNEVTAVKDRIEREVVGADELAHNVKLGRGGIREIEFVVQSLQVLHAGRSPFLQIPQTLPCLDKLAQYHLLADDEAQQLGAAYRFLRDVEHRLQMENNLQTHTLPAEERLRLRLARLMDFQSLEKFETALQTHTGNVRRIYDRLLKSESAGAETGLPPEFDSAESEWEALLAAHSFREPATAFRVFKEFAEGPGDVHVSPRTAELARELIPKFLALCPRRKPEDRRQKTGARKTVSDLRPPASGLRLSDPDRVLTRLASFISAYAARVPLLELWTSNPALFELMLRLFDRSEFLAEIAIRTPDLIDDVVAGERLRQRKTAGQILEELRYGREDADQFLWLRRYHETELMRLGLRDILGVADIEQNLAELSALADACLQYALEVVMRKNKIKKPPLVIIGLGKLGGCEIDYGSDLDLLFVTDGKARDLPQLQRLAVEVMELMSRRTEQGIVFHTDARLRPDGEKGLLVNMLDAYAEYYRQRAQLWEIQALTRTRPVAGNLKLGAQFQNLAVVLTDFSNVGRASSLPPSRLNHKKKGRLEASPALPACYTPDWKTQIHQMRLRIEKERTPRGQDDLAIKTGKGGLMDAEFIAQTLCLENGWHEPNTLRALERGREAGLLPDADRLLDAYRHLRLVEGILRRWSYEGEIVLPDDPAPYYRVSVRCGFAAPDDFRSALAKWRKAIREVHEKVFNAETPRRRGK
ncbi:MAG TPA: bifunctional [glutamate--ammonia ligase]-adenylyl-L-tyrosine phosphorylase/[glutamate--ammonia-ligase] adenylyltransferase [Candidatus Limnocylindrales bacterium]|nr:bifunctional [glutamate--ammonia ligase]-adenylyl-L-tyrosine phosphorylase/[glutamate--ammonia-ligase] adenylyltransferase [Candidatus Limnocylindrales bacterium]